jgi:transcriptional regulator NrdR family protein
MARKKNRSFEIFSLSFLDCICCGFGAVILMFVITTGNGLKAKEFFLAQSSQLIVELEKLIQEKEVTTEQISHQISSAKERLQELAKNEKDSHEIQAKIEQKKNELQSLQAIVRGQSNEINQVKESLNQSYAQQTQPQYLTNFSTDGKRILILLESSGGMLGHSVNEALDILKEPAQIRLQSKKWKRAKEAVKTLLSYLPEDSEYKVIAFNHTLTEIPLQNQSWIAVKDKKMRFNLMKDLDSLQANGGANLEKAFRKVAELQPNNVILISDGLPTLADRIANQGEITEQERLMMFTVAKEVLPSHIPVNILLFPMKADPASAPLFWELAHKQNGSLISPSADWPK